MAEMAKEAVRFKGTTTRWNRRIRTERKQNYQVIGCISEKMINELLKVCKKEGKTKSQVIKDALEYYFARGNKEEI